LFRLSMTLAVLALVVIILGGYVRLSDAGLSCPDWPGCYGQLLVPGEQDRGAAQAAFPTTPLEVGKAWKEMVHRYVAGLLGLGVLALTVTSVRRRHQVGMPVLTPCVLLALIVFQALLGMWTVTLLLKPMVVTAHLMGGLATGSLLSWIALRHFGLAHGWRPMPCTRGRSLFLLGSLVLIVQLTLGGWTSANYAALACPDFPLCNGLVVPEMNLGEGFQLSRELGAGLDGKLISHEGLVAIQFVHRLGAVMTVLLLGICAVLALRSAWSVYRLAGAAMLGLLVSQAALGVATVLNAKPLGYAVAHNANAALLSLSVITMLYVSKYRPPSLVNSTSFTAVKND